VSGVALSPNGNLVAAATTSRLTRVWDANTAKLLYTFSGHTQAVTALVFSKDSKTLLTASASEHKIRFWNVTTGESIDTITNSSVDLVAMAISPDGKLLLTLDAYSVARAWGMSDRALKKTMNLSTSYSVLSSASLEFLPDGDAFLIGFGDSNAASQVGARMYDYATGLAYPLYYPASAGGNFIGAQDATMSSNEKYVITTGDRTAVWDKPTCLVLNQFDQAASQVFSNSDASKLYFEVNADAGYGTLVGRKRDGTTLGGYPFSAAIVAAANAARDRFVIGSDNYAELWPNKGVRLLGFDNSPTNGLDSTLIWGSLDYNSSSYKLDFALYRNGLWQRDLKLGVKVNDITWTWPVTGIAPTSGYTVRAATIDGAYETYTTTFTMQTQSGLPYVQIYDPTAATTWTAGETHRIYWGAVSTEDSFNVKLYQGRVWIKNLSNYVAPGQNYFDWTVDVTQGDYQIKVTASNTESISDTSANIRVLPAPPKNGARDWTLY
jgi:hypothetical protein